jgi:DNA/RNA-binding domain of Phe-tRNA-synthetase-like protein
MTNMIEVRMESDLPGLSVALVESHGVQIEAAAAELRQLCDAAAQAARHAVAGGDARRQAIRGLLRSGGFKPSGRNKPAQEYLLRTATEGGELPAISNAVDLINLVSLQSGLPISLVSLDRVPGPLLLRVGTAGEKFVFNRTGQELDVEGLLSICAASAEGSEPVATPVKDSMRAKVTEEDHHLLACLYASHDAVSAAELRRLAEELAMGFQRFCGAERVQTAFLP